MDTLKGRLLVAAPGMRDPNFERTVVLLLEHRDEGALGVVLNRPSITDLADALPDRVRAAAAPALVFVGGPVEVGSAVCVGRLAGPAHSEAVQPVTDGICVVDLAAPMEDATDLLDGLRVFTGYAGWGAGQLEAEIEAGAWFVVEARPGDVVTSEPEELWPRVLRRQGGKLALVATFPPDPTLN